MEASSQSVQNSAVKVSDVKVSVVQVSFFTGEVLWQSIDSVLHQQGVEVELILVNNGNPPEVLARLEELARESDKITLISGHGNIGFGKACNLGASVAKSDQLLFVNPDCVMFPDCVQKLLASQMSAPVDSIIGGNLFLPAGQKCENANRDFPTPWRLLVESLQLFRLAPKHPYFRRLRLGGESEIDSDASVVSGALMLIRMTAFKLLNGFDEAYFLHVEDIDICLRWHRLGGKTHFNSNAKATHFQSSSQVSWFKLEYHKAKGFHRYFRTHFAKFYPAGFLSLIDLLIYTRLLGRCVLRFASFGYLPGIQRNQVPAST